MTAFVAAAAGLFGLAIGSFLNVVIYLVPQRMSLLHPSVRCPPCGALGLIWFVYPRGMGFGDVRLEVLLGLLLGWASRGTVLAGFLLAFLLGGVLSIVLLATGVRSRKDTIPFGPWLCLGCIIALLWPASGRWIERNEIRPAIDVVKTVF